jgi:hypothetical protein
MSDQIPESEVIPPEGGTISDGSDIPKSDIQTEVISYGPDTSESDMQSGIISNPSAVKHVEPLANVVGGVIPNQSHTSMSPAPFQRGGKSHKKQGQKSQKKQGQKSQKKRGGKSQKKRGGKSQKKQGRKSQKKRGKK